MSRAGTSLILVAVMLAFVPLADAQSRPDRGERMRQLVDRFDADGDGRLSPEERASAREAFGELRQRQEVPVHPQTVVPGETDLYKITPGPHTLTVVETWMLEDARRGKQIPLRLTFPSEGGPYPVIVFCHGALGSKDGGQPMVTHWAAHGYVVIQPTFGDSISLMTPEQRRDVRSLVDLVNSDHVKSRWNDRPADVKHVLDSLDDLQRDVPGLAGRLDPERIMVGGHSYGAHTTMLLAGMTLVEPGGDRTLNLHDPRIDATFMISPQGTGAAITEASYATLRGPILMITGDNDGTPMRGHEDHAGQWRRAAFDHAPPGEKYLLWIRDAYHGFGGINGGPSNWLGAGPVAPDQVYYVKSTILAFADACLKADADALAYLQSDRIADATDDAATLARK